MKFKLIAFAMAFTFLSTSVYAEEIVLNSGGLVYPIEETTTETTTIFQQPQSFDPPSETTTIFQQPQSFDPSTETSTYVPAQAAPTDPTQVLPQTALEQALKGDEVQTETLAPEVFFNEELGGYGIKNYDGEINYADPSEEMKPYTDRVMRNNQYLKTNITIMIGTYPFTLTPSQKARCLAGINTDEPYIDKDAVWNISNNICKLYNHYNDEPFYTTSGKFIHFTCGDYGWSVDFTGLTDKLYEALSTQTDTTLEYIPKNANYNVLRPSMTSDIGPNYVEVDLTNQKIWVYQDNKLVLSDDCVTGKEGCETPTGIWSLKCNEGRTELIGPTWDLWVDYWMHFRAGCGFHDATWQKSFGLDRWKAGYGSHGCVNLKLSTAKRLSEIVYIGEPIIVYS